VRTDGSPVTELFADERAANLTSAVELIEAVLVELGHRLDETRASIPGTIRAWRVGRGSAMVDVVLVDRPDGHHLRVSAGILGLDDKVDRVALFERLLSLNATQLVGAAFALRGDQVLLLGQRSTRDLDRSEVSSLLERVLEDADHFDDMLLAEFGGHRA
jgi:hypothetical protein